MNKPTRLPALALVLLLCACSIRISEVTPATVPSRPTPFIAPTRIVTPVTQASTPPPTSVVPVTWGQLDLTGQLVFITSTVTAQGYSLALARLDLGSGALSVVFQPPFNGWVNAAAVSPDGSAVVIAYAPPPPPGQVQFGYTGLHLLSGECLSAAHGCPPEAPRPLVQPSDLTESFFNPVWSPDGRYLYYSHLIPTRDSEGLVSGFSYAVERLAYPGGQPEPVVEQAYWPRLSPDASRLAYVSFDLTSYTSDLYVAAADGRDPTRIALPASFTAVDAPLFSPDGAWLIVSATDFGSPAALSWLDRLLGVKIASAHNVPSDWWRIPLAGGGQAERLTEIYETGLYGDFSPDGRHFAFVSVSGLFVMEPDGDNLTPLLLGVGALGTVAWMP